MLLCPFKHRAASAVGHTMDKEMGAWGDREMGRKKQQDAKIRRINPQNTGAASAGETPSVFRLKAF